MEWNISKQVEFAVACWVPIAEYWAYIRAFLFLKDWLFACWVLESSVRMTIWVRKVICHMSYYFMECFTSICILVSIVFTVFYISNVPFYSCSNWVHFGAYLSLLSSCNYFLSIMTCLFQIYTATNKRLTANRKDETHNKYIYPTNSYSLGA